MKYDGFYVLAGGIKLDIELTNYVEGEEPTITADPYDSDPGSAPEAEFNLYYEGKRVDPYYIFEGSERLDERVEEKIVDAHEAGLILEFGDLDEGGEIPSNAIDFDLQGIPTKLVISNKPDYEDRYDMDFELYSLEGHKIDVESLAVNTPNGVEELHNYVVQKVYGEDPEPENRVRSRLRR